MDVFVGRITSTGFSTGDRIVIGDWRESPLGSFTNIMWAKPDGSRILLSPSERHVEYVSKLYNFEEVKVTEITVQRRKRGMDRTRQRTQSLPPRMARKWRATASEKDVAR